jgi:hypothetical protein
MTASTIDGGSNTSEGYKTQAPCDHAARFPRTRRVYITKDQIISGFCNKIENLSKQWNNGGTLPMLIVMMQIQRRKRITHRGYLSQ